VAVNIILFLVYSLAIELISKYILYHFVDRITSLLKLKANTVGQILGYLASLPELTACIFIAYHGMLLMVSYNILSSNIINITLAVLMTILFKKISDFKHYNFKIDFFIIAISIILPFIMLKMHLIENKVILPIYLVLYLVYLIIIKRQSKKDNLTAKSYLKKLNFLENKLGKKCIIIYSLIIIFGTFLIYIFGEKLGSIVYELGESYKVPQIVLGVIIGFITSLPELIMFIETYINNKGKYEMVGAEEVLNDVVASNTTNLLLVQSIGMIIYFFLYKS
jgi:cation:H+ antiporter